MKNKAQPRHVSVARKVWQGRAVEDALVQIFPADVHQPGVKVAHVHVERILDLASLLECTDGEACARVRRERVILLNGAAAIPQKHATAVECPYGFLRRASRNLLMVWHALTRFSGEEESVLCGEGLTHVSGL